MEDDLIIEPIKELGFEGFLRFTEDFLFDDGVVLFLDGGTEAHGAAFANEFGADIGGHNDDGVSEIDFAGKAIGDLTVLENLQEYVPDIRMGFFDFIEKDDAVGAAADFFGELATLFVADVAWRRADEAGDVKLLHVFGHIELDEGILFPEDLFGEGFGQVGFADAGWTEEEERADGAFGVFEIGARAAKSFGEGLDRLGLADDAGLQIVAEGEEFGEIRLFHTGEGDARPFGDDMFYIFLADIDDDLVTFFPPGIEVGFEFGGGFFLPITEGGGAFKILGFNGGFFFGADGFDLGGGGFKLGGAEAGGDAAAGTGFVHDIDGFIGEVTSGDIAFAEADGGGEGLVGNFGVMVGFVFGAETVEDGDGFIDGGGIDADGLETAFEGGVFFDIFAVLVHGGGADALEFAAGKGGFNDIGGVHGALG